MPSVCLNHTDRLTETRCISCLRPICQECIYDTPDGRFCGEDCHQKALAHFKRAALHKDRGGRSPLMAFLETVVTMGVVGAVAYFVWPHLPAPLRHQLLHYIPGMH